MTDQSLAQSKQAADQGAALSNKVDQILANIVQDIRNGTRKLTSSSSKNDEWNIWDILTNDLRIKNCSPELIQRYRVLVKQSLLDLLQNSGFTGDVCKDCLDPTDVHGTDHVPSPLQTQNHETEASTTNDLQLLRHLHAKEREDFKTYCLKRASYHNTMGNLAVILGTIFIILPFMIWSTVDVDVYYEFAQRVEENMYTWVDHIRGFIGAWLSGTQYDPSRAHYSQRDTMILDQHLISGDLRDLLSVWKRIEESQTRASSTPG